MRDFDNFFFTSGDLFSHLLLSAKNHFPIISGGHLEILHKMPKHIYLGNSIMALPDFLGSPCEGDPSKGKHRQ